MEAAEARNRGPSHRRIHPGDEVERFGEAHVLAERTIGLIAEDVVLAEDLLLVESLGAAVLAVGKCTAQQGNVCVGGSPTLTAPAPRARR